MQAPNNTAYRRWSCHSGTINRFLARQSCGPAGWLSLLPTKPGDVETNPGPTTLNKQVWMCDICHKQIHVRKQISMRCNRIKHWVHLRCAGIRQAQYTDTWTCHLYRESRIMPHTDITPPHRSRPYSKPHTHSPPTPPQPKHRHMSNTPTVPTGLVKPKPNSLIHSVRTDRLHKAGGGLITLIRDNITFTTTDIHSTINTHNTELQMVKVHINNTKHITIANIYIPPRDTTSTHYKTADTDLQHCIQYITNISHSVLTGDVNAHSTL